VSRVSFTAFWSFGVFLCGLFERCALFARVPGRGWRRPKTRSGWGPLLANANHREAGGSAHLGSLGASRSRFLPGKPAKRTFPRPATAGVGSAATLLRETVRFQVSAHCRCPARP